MRFSKRLVDSLWWDRIILGAVLGMWSRWIAFDMACWSTSLYDFRCRCESIRRLTMNMHGCWCFFIPYRLSIELLALGADSTINDLCEATIL